MEQIKNFLLGLAGLAVLLGFFWLLGFMGRVVLSGLSMI